MACFLLRVPPGHGRHRWLRAPAGAPQLLTSTAQLQILPLALIMVMGPQILTAIFLVTSREPVKNSAAMLIGVLLAATVGLAIWTVLVNLIGIDPSGDSGPSTADYVVAGLLALVGIRTFLGRGTGDGPEMDGRPSAGGAEAGLQPRLPVDPADADGHSGDHRHRALPR